jgi:hypothetical protein
VGVESYFVRVGAERFRPSRHTGGGWSTEQQHIAPAVGLMVHALDGWVAARGADDRVTARLAVEILGTMPLTDVEVAVEQVRGGRTVELLEVVLSCEGRPAARTRAWRMVTRDTADVAGGAVPTLPAPDGLDRVPLDRLWPGGYIASLDVRRVGEPVPGRGSAWIRTGTELVAGEPAGALARFALLVDTANGIAVRQPPSAWTFPNLDLTMHFHRQPAGDGWVGLETTCVFGPDGQGLTSSVLHDRHGPVGRAEQILTLRPTG